jgi:hypothetical protein
MTGSMRPGAARCGPMRSMRPHAAPCNPIHRGFPLGPQQQQHQQRLGTLFVLCGLWLVVRTHNRETGRARPGAGGYWPPFFNNKNYVFPICHLPPPPPPPCYRPPSAQRL